MNLESAQAAKIDRAKLAGRLNQLFHAQSQEGMENIIYALREIGAENLPPEPDKGLGNLKPAASVFASFSGEEIKTPARAEETNSAPIEPAGFETKLFRRGFEPVEMPNPEKIDSEINRVIKENQPVSAETERIEKVTHRVQPGDTLIKILREKLERK